MSNYHYGPPPPPPAAQPAPQGYGQYQQHGGATRGALTSRGRGGYSSSGRYDYHQPSAPYEYGGQPPYPAATPYTASQPPASSYSGHQQWAQDQRHQQAQPHAPAPLSTANYHPNYAPQHYAQGHSQHQPTYVAPTPAPVHQYHPAPAPYASQPYGHEQQAQAPQYGAHPRGGYGSDRGGSRAPSMSAQARPEYGGQGMQPQVTAAYAPQPYPDPRAVPTYPQPQYPYPPPPAPSQMSSRGRDGHFKHDGHHGHSGGGRGGRGGGRGGGNHRAKQHHQGGDRNRFRQNGPRPDHANNAQKRDNHDNTAGKKKKRKTNTLGLTPGQDSDTEDDEKEEETLQKLLGHDALQVSDIASYVAERKKNFPTAARAKARKDAEMANSNGDKRATALEKQEKMAEKLRKQLEKVESSIKRKREQQDEGDEMRDSSVSVKSDDDEDDQPETMSTRAQQPLTQGSSKKADITKQCKYFATGGTCGKKGKCRFVHDADVRAAAIKEQEANNGQLTIQQRLILNDKDQEDLTVLQSIQYLREKGMIPDEEKPAISENKRTPATTQTLPQAHGLPAKPPTKRDHRPAPREPPPSAIQMAKTGAPSGYKGWNLNGYGNSGLKSEDLP